MVGETKCSGSPEEGAILFVWIWGAAGKLRGAGESIADRLRVEDAEAPTGRRRAFLVEGRGGTGGL